MIYTDNYIPMDDITSIKGINQIHCDTRDFKCLVKDEWITEHHRWEYQYGLVPASENPGYLIPEGEVLDFLHRTRSIVKEGFKEMWRPLHFKDVANGQWLKYIRMYRLPQQPDQFIVCDREGNPIEWRNCTVENLKTD